MAEARGSLDELIGRQVSLDTAGPMTFLGTLTEICEEGFWLSDADVRDRNEGHVSKERYVCEACKRGIRANRRRLFVFAHVVVSISALEDVVAD